MKDDPEFEMFDSIEAVVLSNKKDTQDMAANSELAEKITVNDNGSWECEGAKGDSSQDLMVFLRFGKEKYEKLTC